jgi:hypothetical protein
MKIFFLSVILAVLSNATLQETLHQDADILQETIVSAAKDLKDGTIGVRDGIIEKVIAFKDATSHVAKDAASNIREKVESAKEWVSDEAAIISDAVAAAGSVIKEKVHQLKDEAGSVVHKVKEKILNEDL